MALPLVSIVIPVFNAERFIGSTIESALAQDWPHTEVVAVDDGSSDHSLAVLRRYEHAGVRVITKANGGGPAARNTGFEASRGDFIQFLDHDDLLAADKVSAQMAAAAGRLTVPVVGLWTRFRGDASRAHGGWQPPEPLRHDWDPTDWLIASPLVPTCAWLTPRPLVERAGPWNEALVENPDDDGEFFMRVVARAERVVFCERARSYFRTEDDSSAGHNRGVNALRAIFQVCTTYEQIVRTRTDAVEARRACAHRYLVFMHMAYPLCPDLVGLAEARVADLGFDPARVPNTPAFERLSSVVGWRTARRLQRLWQAVRRAGSREQRSFH